MALDLDRYNKRIQSWADGALTDMKATANGMDIRHRPKSPSRGDSLRKLKGKVYTDGIAAERVGFTFPRSLIYTHKGAGRSQGGLIGSTWYNKKGEKRETNSLSKGKSGQQNRKVKPWFNTFIEGPEGVDEVASIAAEELGDAIVNKMLIK